MYSIKYQGEFFDIAPDESIEIERKSPLFIVEDIIKENSTPISFLYTDKNCRLLGQYFFDITVKAVKKITVELYDDGSFDSNCTLVIESAGMNRMFNEKSSASGYLLIGISNFYSTIQNKKLTELFLDGARSFTFTTWDADDSSGGFMQHFQDTWDGTYDYVIAPCRNEFWNGITDDVYSSGYMNEIDENGNLKAEQDIVPFIKLAYVLEKIFTENNWKVDFTGLNDTQWQKLVLFCVKAIITRTSSYDIFSPTVVTSIPVDSLSFNLNNFLPADYTCSDFIVQLCKRYAWVPIFDINTNSCRFIALKEMKNKPRKDWTKYALPTVGSTVNGEAVVFGFKNNFDGNDNFVSSPDFENWNIGSAVYSKADLPDIYGFTGFDSVQDNTLVYVFAENKYYHVVYESGSRQWVVFADNIYDETKDTVTNSFETKCTTLPMYNTQYRTLSGINYYALLPYCEQSRYERAGLRTLLYHGMVDETKLDGTAGPKQYPYMSSIHIPPMGTPALTWSNVYRHKYGEDDFGLIEYWWQDWMNMISGPEDDVKQQFTLPAYELAKYQFDDKILVNNVEYLFRSYVKKTMQDGKVLIEATMQRLVYGQQVEVPVEGGGTIYLRLEVEILGTEQTFDYYSGGNHTYYTHVTNANVFVRGYSDAACTVRVSLTNLLFKYRVITTLGGGLYTTVNSTYLLNGYEVNIIPGMFRFIDYTVVYTWTSGTPPPNGHYVITYELIADAAYTIIV